MTALLTIGSFVVTPEMLLPLMVLAGIFIMFGAKKIAGAIFILVLLVAFAPLIEGIFSEIFDALPGWIAVVALIVLGWVLLRYVAELILGREGAGNLLGNLATVFVLAALRFPFRVLGGLYRLLLRR
ncbi:MAG: hypothetical protein BWK76_25305 [Desulfobulbaceae bacterium A2]|nr:MAG: hypothetical protein BWK76_25305 [Desulfobulbaceae bacterium A2]